MVESPGKAHHPAVVLAALGDTPEEAYYRAVLVEAEGLLAAKLGRTLSIAWSLTLNDTPQYRDENGNISNALAYTAPYAYPGIVGARLCLLRRAVASGDRRDHRAAGPRWPTRCTTASSTA